MLALNGNVVIVGRGSNMITKKIKGGFHVRLVATLNHRVDNVSKIMNISKTEVTKLIDEKSKQREGYLREFFKFDLTDPHHYDLVVNEGRFTAPILPHPAHAPDDPGRHAQRETGQQHGLYDRVRCIPAHGGTGPRLPA